MHWRLKWSFLRFGAIEHPIYPEFIRASSKIGAPEHFCEWHDRFPVFAELIIQPLCFLSGIGFKIDVDVVPKVELETH